MDGIGCEMAEFLPREPLLGMGQEILVGEVGTEEGGVVGVEGDQQSRIEVAAQRVMRKGRANAGADVGGGIQLEGDALGTNSAMRAGSSMAESAWPMRSEPMESASRMASGPVVSPA